MLKLGCHVGMAGKEMMLGSVKDAVRFGANTFMLYTGAPQNTKRKAVEELRIPEAKALMQENGIEEFVVHAPYIINLANTVKPEDAGDGFGNIGITSGFPCGRRDRCRSCPDCKGNQ